jgi:L-lactate dehydrogenase complex protein LldG
MKAEILASIRSAIGTRGEDVPVVRNYRQTGTLDEAGRLAQFISRLEDYNAGVYRCSPGDVANAIAGVMTERSKKSLLIPPQLPQDWLPSEKTFVRDHQLSYAGMDQADGVLTGCTVAVSLTGTIILSHSAHEGRRALTLIPDYHLCVVRADQVVETVPEGLRMLREVRGRPITTISGPSATADIEMIRIKGVHGPRFLDVILVGG